MDRELGDDQRIYVPVGLGQAADSVLVTDAWSRGRRPVGVVCRSALVLLLIAVAGCSSGGSTSQGPYAADIKAAASQATSDFERQVLSDGVITRQEYEEAYQRYVDCAKQRGIDVSLVDQGGWYVVSMPTSPEADRVDYECSKGNTALIAGLYTDMVRNPTKEDVDKLQFDCLVKAGVTPDGYTLEEYKLDKKATEESGPNNGGGASGVAGSRVFGAPPTNPYPFDLSDPRYAACINNPVAPPTQ